MEASSAIKKLSGLTIYISSDKLNQLREGGKWWDISSYEYFVDFESAVEEYLILRGDYAPSILCLDCENDNLGLYLKKGIEWVRTYFDVMREVKYEEQGEVFSEERVDSIFSAYRNISKKIEATELMKMIFKGYLGRFESVEAFSLNYMGGLIHKAIPSGISDYIDFQKHAEYLDVNGYNFAKSVTDRGVYAFTV